MRSSLAFVAVLLIGLAAAAVHPMGRFDDVTANATARVESELFTKVNDAVVPLLNSLALTQVVPGEKFKHFSYQDLYLSSFNLGGATMSPVAPNKIVMNVVNLSLAVPQTGFGLFLGPAKCTGHFWMSMTDATLSITVDLSTNPEGHLSFNFVSAKSTYGSLNVKHDLNGVVCSIGQDILQLFLGNIDKRIKELIMNKLPNMMGPKLASATTTELSEIPLKFIGQPVVSSSAIVATVDLLSAPMMMSMFNATAPATTGAAAIAAAGAREINLAVPTSSLNMVLSAMTKAGKLGSSIVVPGSSTAVFKNDLPKAYAACPDCEIKLVFTYRQAPTVSTGSDTVKLSTDDLLVEVRGGSSSTSVELFVLSASGALSVTKLGVTGTDGTSLYFNLAIDKLQLSAYQSNSGTISNAVLSSIQQLVEDKLVPSFNRQFSGYQMPSKVNNGFVSVQQGSVGFGFDVVIPSI